ncbi:hypothetical protein BVRB_7g168090 [Beta vulgaris subsp. vulgaris]|uniref:Uncharacterized protein n=1 Tax=Beta vulgaris subsp. vulgaris TaxID=3555 RepID=A0A0J8C069_BETVV|nr:hypothetical protein BVRB_7g168090 [Beta vulgaris subsp. vulgaris]
MKPTFVVFFGLLISIGLITNNQVACGATSISDPCKKPNPPPHCLTTLTVDPCKKPNPPPHCLTTLTIDSCKKPNPPPHCAGSHAKKAHTRRECSKTNRCQRY